MEERNYGSSEEFLQSTYFLFCFKNLYFHQLYFGFWDLKDISLKHGPFLDTSTHGAKLYYVVKILHYKLLPYGIFLRELV